MKHTLAILLIFLIAAAPAFAQDWEVLDYPLDDNVTGLAVLSADTIFLVTDAGNLARTFDGGIVWQARGVGNSVPLQDVQFLDNGRAFICGQQGRFFRSVNGGNTWQDCFIADTSVRVLSLEMINDRVGFATGLVPRESGPPEGRLYRTINGGKEWQLQKSDGAGFGALFYYDHRAIYYPSYGKLHGSIDEGETWTVTDLNLQHPIRDLAMLNRVGLAASTDGACARTTNGGATWTEVILGTQAHLTSALMITDRLGVVAGYQGTMFVTRDGGLTFAPELLPETFNIFTLALEGGWLYAAGSGGNVIRKKISHFVDQ